MKWRCWRLWENLSSSGQNHWTLLFSRGNFFSCLILPSMQFRLACPLHWGYLQCSIHPFCRWVGQFQIELNYSTSDFQFNLRWMAMLLDGWKLGEFATVNKEWRDFKRGLEEVEKVEEGPQRGLEDTRVNGWLMGVLENLKSWTWIWTLSHKLVMLNESGSMILHREISFPMFNICDHFVATFNSTWFFLH